jgi:dTDP-4-dehydrorhamnose 3,5-epimerase
MIFAKLELPDLLIIEPDVFKDSRGFFTESWNERAFAEKGFTSKFVQDNHSNSVKNCLRGLHYQIQHAQGKLIRVVSGEVFDVAVDLRKSSEHFGKWTSVILSSENKKMFWIPPGFAHGYFVLSHSADLVYKVTEHYYPEFERTIKWNDPGLNIQWPIPAGKEPLISAKDAAGAPFDNAECY